MKGDFALFGELSKIEEQDDGTLMVFGVASSGARDEAGEIVLSDAMKAALPAYALYPAVREMHGPSAAGTMSEASVDDEGFTRVCAHVVDPVAIKKVQTKTYRGFSIGGRVLKRDPKDPTIITAIKLSEISLVDRPCNPEASIDLWKADIGETKPMADYTPTNDEVKARAGEMAKAAGKMAMDSFKGYVAKAREALIAEHVEPALEPSEDEIAKAACIAAVGEPGEGEIIAKNADGAWAKFVIAPEVAEAVAKVAGGLADADRAAVLVKVHLATVDGADLDEAVTKAIADHQAAREAPEADPAAILDAAVEKAKAKAAPKPYGDVEYADAKNGKYPIDTAAHIRAAWSYINMPKNEKGYSDGELKAIKGKIVAAWKSKIDPSGPPSAEKAALLGDLAKSVALVTACETVALEKGFYTVGRQAALLAAAADIAMSVVYEERHENDTASTQPQAMLDIVAALHQLVISGANEETAEFMHAAELAGADGVTLLAPCLEIDVMEMATKLGDLHKADTALMEKVGARNSKTDASHIQAAHDHMAKAGATCDAANCPDPDAEKGAQATDLAKGVADVAAERLAKQDGEIADLNKRLEGEADRTATAIEAALEKFRKEPVPPKTAATTHIRIDKAADVAPSEASELDDAQKAELTTWWAGLTPDQRAFESMKSTFRAPVQAR